MSIIYVNGGYKSSSNISHVLKINELQDERIEKLELILEGSDGNVDNPEVLNTMIKINTENITTNTKDIQSLKTKVETVELVINTNTLTINGITVSLSSIDSKIDSLNKKIDNLDTSGLSWVEVQSINN